MNTNMLEIITTLRSDGYYEAQFKSKVLEPNLVFIARSELMAMGFAMAHYGDLLARRFPPTEIDFARTTPGNAPLKEQP